MLEHMFALVERLVGRLRGVVRELDPASLSGPDAVRMLDALSEMERLLRKVINDRQLESVVTACRAFPQLAVASRNDVGLGQALATIFMRSRDADIARRAGLRVVREHRLKREPLSAREREVYELLIHGRGNREIAEALFISESTAKVHVRHILEKLGAHSKLEAVVRAADRGLLEP